MSWAKCGTIQSQKNRIATIQKRTLNTEMPPLHVLFSTFVKEGNAKITKDLVDKVYFENFPSKDASGALSALSMNVKNIEGLRQSGSLGVVIEMLRRLDFSVPQDETHITDLVRSVSILTEDIEAQTRFLSNPSAITSILQLCVHTSGVVQERIFRVVERMCKTDFGIRVFMGANIFNILLSPEMLYRPSTQVLVRQSAANLVSFLTNKQPDTYPIDRMEEVLVSNGVRLVDGYIEMQLLSALLSHLTWLTAEKEQIHGCHDLLNHIIEEVKDETFEDLDHLLQILRVLTIVSRDLTYGKFLLAGNIGIALQYVVRTDFELWRKSLDTYKKRPNSAQNGVSSGGSGSTLRGTAGGRPTTSSSSNNTLNAIRNIRSVKKKKNDEINFKTTKAVVLIYESLLKLGVHVIGGIVSSGLIAGLLFRVGKGKNIDKRFYKLVVHFLFQMLVQVAMEEPVGNRSMSMIGIDVSRQASYTRGGTKRASTSVRIQPSMINQKVEAVTVRSVSNKLHAQGVTELLIQCLVDGDDYEIVPDALTSLASMHFPVIKSSIMKLPVLGKICAYALARQDCYFSGLSLVCDAVNSPPMDHFPKFVSVCVNDFRVINILVKAMKLSGWIFNMKGNVYDAMAVLSTDNTFRDKVSKARGVNCLVYEIDARRRQKAAKRALRQHDVDEDVSTELLFVTFKEDWAATKIQAIMRANKIRNVEYKQARRASLSFDRVVFE